MNEVKNIEFDQPVSLALKPNTNGSYTVSVHNLSLLTFLDMNADTFSVRQGVIRTWLEDDQIQRRLPWNPSLMELRGRLRQNDLITCDLITNLGFQIESDVHEEVILQGVSTKSMENIVRNLCYGLLGKNIDFELREFRPQYLQVRLAGLSVFRSFDKLIARSNAREEDSYLIPWKEEAHFAESMVG